MCDDKAKVMKMVKGNGWNLRTASEDLRSDKEVVLAAVKQNGRALKYASDDLKADREVVLEAVKQNWIALGYAATELRDDDEIMLEAVKQDGTALQYYRRKKGGEWMYQFFPAAILKEVNSQDCYNALSAAVPHGGVGFEEDYAKWWGFREKFKPKEMPVRSMVGMEHWNREETLDAVGVYGLALGSANEAFRTDREIVLAAVKQNGLAMRYASEELRADREVVLAGIEQNGMALAYASEGLWSDREIVLVAVTNYGSALQYASEELRADREVVLEATKQNGLVMQYASEELRADREVVLAAVKQNGLAQQYASEELRADREVVLAAVKQNGLALQYAREELMADKELVLAAIKQDDDACRFIKSSLLSDKDVLMELARSYKGSLYNPFTPVYYHENALNAAYGDRDVVIELVKQHICDWNEVSRDLCADKTFVMEALKCIEQGHKESVSRNQYGKDYSFLEFSAQFEHAMENIDEELKKDLEIQQVAESLRAMFDIWMSSDDNVFDVPDKESSLWKDREFVLNAVKRIGTLLKYAPDFRSDDEIKFTAVKQNGMALEFVDAELSPGFLDKELVLEAVKQNGMALEFADTRLRADKEVVLAAVNQDRNALDFVHPSLRHDKEVLLAAVSNGASLYQIAMERWSVVKAGDIDLLRAQEDYKKRIG